MSVGADAGVAATLSPTREPRPCRGHPLLATRVAVVHVSRSAPAGDALADPPGGSSLIRSTTTCATDPSRSMEVRPYAIPGTATTDAARSWRGPPLGARGTGPSDASINAPINLRGTVRGGSRRRKRTDQLKPQRRFTHPLPSNRAQTHRLACGSGHRLMSRPVERCSRRRLGAFGGCHPARCPGSQTGLSASRLTAHRRLPPS